MTPRGRSAAKRSQGSGQLRIVGGALRGRRIALPPSADASLRPTTDRVREALFNILEHRFVGQEGFRLVGARVLDGFAGSGALGLEALSRGAAKAVFLDKDPGHCAALRRAVTELDLADRAAVLRADLLAPAPPQDGPVDLVLLDPPYGTDLGRRGVQALAQAGWTRPGTIISLEDNAAIAEADLPGVQLVDQRRYGKAWISLCRV